MATLQSHNHQRANMPMNMNRPAGPTQLYSTNQVDATKMQK